MVFVGLCGEFNHQRDHGHWILVPLSLHITLHLSERDRERERETQTLGLLGESAENIGGNLNLPRPSGGPRTEPSEELLTALQVLSQLLDDGQKGRSRV